MTDPLVVVGASVAATAFLERMRELGSTERIVVVDADPDAPYDRPPLSKHYLLHGEPDDIAVDWADLDVELVRAEAVGLAPDARGLRVRADGGERVIRYRRLVIATGAQAARLPIEPPDTLVLRTAADTRRLRERMRPGRSVVIVGAGAVGVELASSLVARDARVVLLDRARGPLERLLAGHLAEQVTAWLEEAGVDCRWGAGITGIERHGDGWAVGLDGGEVLAPEIVVSAVGARPAVGWLAGGGLLDEGRLMVDDEGRVLAAGAAAAPDVFAIGDAVTRRHRDGSLERTESWTAARAHGTRLAEDLCGAPRSPEPAPYFWTEVAGRKVQVVGMLRPGATVTLEASQPERQSALYRVGTGRERPGWIGVNAQRRVAQLMIAGDAVQGDEER